MAHEDELKYGMSRNNVRLFGKNSSIKGLSISQINKILADRKKPIKINNGFTPEELKIIKDKIEELGLKKKFVANKIGMTKQSFSFMLTGERMYIKKKQSLLDFLSINFDVNPIE